MFSFFKEGHSDPLPEVSDSARAIVNGLSDEAQSALAVMGRLGENAAARADKLTNNTENYGVKSFGKGFGEAYRAAAERDFGAGPG